MERSSNATVDILEAGSLRPNTIDRTLDTTSDRDHQDQPTTSAHPPSGVGRGATTPRSRTRFMSHVTAEKQALTGGKMKHSNKKVVQVLLAVIPCITLMAAVLIKHSQLPMRSRQWLGPIRIDNPVVRPQVAAFTAQMKAERDLVPGETFDQSVFRAITNDLQYFGHGVEYRFGVQNNLEQMLACPRAVKVIQAVQALPVKDRERCCKDLFAVAFWVHTNAMSSLLRMPTDPAYTNRVSMLSSQMGVCLAAFVAADFGMRDTLSNELAQLYRLRAEVAEPAIAGLAAGSDFDRGFAQTVRSYYLPDNRFQLNLLRLVAQRDTKGGDGVLDRVDEELRTNTIVTTTSVIPMAKWDAEVNWFEEALPMFQLEGRKMDPKDVVRRYEVLNWDVRMRNSIEDEDLNVQQELIGKLRYLVFGSQR
jgi:hypothetical protein